MSISSEKYYPFDAVEWITQNMGRNYPLADDMVVQSVSGSYLPSSFLADLSMRILPGNLGQDSFFVSSVVNSGDTITVLISCHTGTGIGDFVCARAAGIPSSLNAGDTIASRTFSLSPVLESIPDDYSDLTRLSGTLIVGTCADIVSDYALTYAHGQIASTCIVKTLAGLYSITFEDSSGTATRFENDFTIQAGDGIEFEVMTTAEGSVLKIYRVATAAEVAAEYKSVQDVVDAIYAEFGEPIRSINGTHPDSSGNIDILGSDCTTVSTGTNSISISNTCAKPCCGETSTQDVESAISDMEEMKTRLLNYYESLSSNVSILQSRLASLIAADNS